MLKLDSKRGKLRAQDRVERLTTARHQRQAELAAHPTEDYRLGLWRAWELACAAEEDGASASSRIYERLLAITETGV